MCADKKGHPRVAFESVRYEDLRIVIRVSRIVLPKARYLADDSHPGPWLIILAEETQPFADGIFVRPMPGNELPADNRRFLARQSVAVFEFASAHGHAQQTEIVF